MGGQRHEVGELAQLGELQGELLRTAWRRGLAALAAACSGDHVLPLEGLNPTALLESVRRASEEGLLDDWSWLSPPHAAIALYQLAAALPASQERQRVQQMIVERLANGNAETFVGLATALAQGSRQGFAGSRMRSRVALCLALPIGTGVAADRLALALISQPDLRREWLERPSQGSLPSRRLAARLLERASREAARRYAQRDDSGLRALEGSAVRDAWTRLLNDRESLVWRHVAVARGLISEAVPSVREDIKRLMDPEQTATEWRRGGASLAASIAVSPEVGVAAVAEVLQGPVIKNDPGVASAMLMGIARAAEAQPEAAESLLVPLVHAGGIQSAEVLVDLLREGIHEGFGAESMAYTRQLLSEQLERGTVRMDDGQIAFISTICDRLSPEHMQQRPPVDERVLHALYRFAAEGAGPALSAAEHALEAAGMALDRLESSSIDAADGRVAIVEALTELDMGLLQSAALSDLLTLGLDEQRASQALNELYERMNRWALSHEQQAITEARVAHPTLRMRRIRSLLHMVDADGNYGDGQVSARLPRRLKTARVFFHRTQRDVASPLKRAVLATLARACDALVREEAFELSDIILCTSLHVQSAQDVATLSEASMVPELENCLNSLAVLVARTVNSPDNVTGRRDCLKALAGLVHTLPADHSPRVSVLRWSLLRVELSLSALHGARSLSELVAEDERSPLSELADALQALSQLVAAARRRLHPTASVPHPMMGQAIDGINAAIEQAVAERDLATVVRAVGAFDERARAELPAPLYSTTIRVLGALKALPLDVVQQRRSKVAKVTSPGTDERGLPAWLPPNRILGGFYVVNAIGEGGVGSVFTVKRAEERNETEAEQFALKVPEYDGEMAHALSEADFLTLFREEAGALLAMPADQPNLARFVTFDAGARPKPLLVMEYVEGPNLDRLLQRRHMDVAQAIAVLDGIAKGLNAMHNVGIAHLDVKPSNVILRNFWAGAELSPVLVDFGLSGRRLRPGCGTANYAGPEIWGLSSSSTDPRPADAYSYCCLAFELLTGQCLFEAESEVALVTAHINHDGTPGVIESMHRDEELAPLAQFLTAGLRQDPADRVSVADLRRSLPTLRDAIGHMRWPIYTGAGPLTAESVQKAKLL